jgi:hypothetical protein
MLSNGLFINNKVPILEVPHKLLTPLKPLLLAYNINQDLKVAAFGEFPAANISTRNPIASSNVPPLQRRPIINQ